MASTSNTRFSDENCLFSPERRIISGDKDLYWYNDNTSQTPHQSNLKTNQEDKLDNACTVQNIDDNKAYNQFDDIMSRDEIIGRRREKVAANRRRKRMELKQLKQIVSGVQVAKPDFSLEQAAEDFPALFSLKPPKKTKCIMNKEIKVNSLPDDRSETKSMGKSWKPKVKDPLCIDLCQVLLPKPEKPKNIVKKIEQPNDRPKLVGNTLDSDNPTLKKGKVRPNKVKKLSKLKAQILCDRHEHQSRLTSNIEDEQPIVEENISPPRTELTDEINNLLAKCTVLETDVKLSSVEEPDHNQLAVNVVKNIHLRKFREYCTNCITNELVASVCALLDKVAYFQDRTFAKDPIKANAKRRYVAGLNQTNKFLKVKKIKLLIIAPDLEKSPGTDGLDVRISHFKDEADLQGVPCVFGPNRRKLGKAVLKSALVSCVGILSYEGAEDQFAKVIESLQEAKLQYQNLVAESNKEDQEDKDNESQTDVTSLLLSSLKEELVSPGGKLLKALNHTSH